MNYKQMVSVLVLVVMALVPPCHARSRHPDTVLTEDFESFLANVDPVVKGAENSFPAAVEHHVYRRGLVDTSCKGLYKRKMWSKLSQACEDCQNLFRERNMANTCRSGCYHNDTFKTCVKALLLPLHQYDGMAKLLRGS